MWGRDKQIALIESIFKNYYVPPLVFSVQEDPEYDAPLRVCMDGKQRLTSIISFFDGQVRRLEQFVLLLLTELTDRYLVCITCNPVMKSQCSLFLSDKSPDSRKAYYYTLPSTSKKNQLEVPEYYKRIFASKKLRCGT